MRSRHAVRRRRTLHRAPVSIFSVALLRNIKMSMHTRAALLCVGLLAASGCGLSGPPDVTSPSSLLERELSSGRTPGAQYRFFSADSVLYRWDGGWADVAEIGRAHV